MREYLKIALLFVFVVPFFAQGPPNKNWVHYVKEITVPKSGKITVVYDDLYPGKRSERGGCWFMDLTKSKSLMPIVEDKPDHVTIRATPGHVVKYDCNWMVGEPQGDKVNGKLSPPKPSR